MRRQCKHAMAVTAVSDNLLDFAKKYNDITLKLPTGIDEESVKKSLGVSVAGPVDNRSIIYISTFGPWSQPIEAIKSVVELKGEFPSIRLTLIGTGTETSKIKDYIHEHKLGKYIHYLKATYDRKLIFSYIKNTEVGLNISRKDKFRDSCNPGKVLDYSAMGKKVVSTNLREVESLNLPNIFIFKDSDNRRAMKAAIRRALLYKNSANEYAPISKYILDTFNWDKLCKDLLNISAEGLSARSNGHE